MIIGIIMTVLSGLCTAGMTIGATTGLITWTPVNTQIGDQSVMVVATDTGGARDSRPSSCT